MEDFCMDVLAWTIAVGLWYIPFIEVQNDDNKNNNDDDKKSLGDADADADAQDNLLEYREDYGPSVSSWREKPKKPSRDDKKNQR